MMGLLNSGPTMHIKTSVRVTFFLLTGVYFLTGVAGIAVGVYFMKTSSESRRVVLVTDNVLKSLCAAGGYVVLNGAMGVYGALSPLRRKRSLQAYCWLIAVAIAVEVSVGIWVWYRTLDANGMYAYNWRHLWAESVKRIFQDEGGCCGYISPQDSPARGSRACDGAVYGCMLAVRQYAQDYLTYIYTCLFCFVFIDVAAMLSGMVLLVLRNDEERWRWSRSKYIFKAVGDAAVGGSATTAGSSTVNAGESIMGYSGSVHFDPFADSHTYHASRSKDEGF